MADRGVGVNNISMRSIFEINLEELETQGW